jgi:hypothetical protein
MTPNVPHYQSGAALYYIRSGSGKYEPASPHPIIASPNKANAIQNIIDAPYVGP